MALLHYFTKPDAVRRFPIVITGLRLWVSKEILSLHSEFFRAMFNGGFAEANAPEIVLPGKQMDDMLALFSCIMVPPTGEWITAATVESILRLADEFQMQSIARRVSDRLHKIINQMENQHPDLLDMLVVASKYKLLEPLTVLVKRCALEFELPHLELLSADLRQETLIGLWYYSTADIPSCCVYVIRPSAPRTCKNGHAMESVAYCINCEDIRCLKCIAESALKKTTCRVREERMNRAKEKWEEILHRLRSNR